MFSVVCRLASMVRFIAAEVLHRGLLSVLFPAPHWDSTAGAVGMERSSQTPVGIRFSSAVTVGIFCIPFSVPTAAVSIPPPETLPRIAPRLPPLASVSNEYAAPVRPVHQSGQHLTADDRAFSASPVRRGIPAFRQIKIRNRPHSHQKPAHSLVPISACTWVQQGRYWLWRTVATYQVDSFRFSCLFPVQAAACFDASVTTTVSPIATHDAQQYRFSHGSIHPRFLYRHLLQFFICNDPSRKSTSGSRF